MSWRNHRRCRSREPNAMLLTIRRSTNYTWNLFAQPKHRLRALGFLVSSLAHLRHYGAWFKFLEGIPDAPRREEFLQLIMAPARPYLRRWLGAAEKMRILEGHHRIFENRLRPETRRRLQLAQNVLLAGLTGQSGREYRIVLARSQVKEGDITLSFVDAATGAPLARLRGSFGPDDEGRGVFWIGGLMGATPPLGRAEIRAATQDLNGLRPKHALMHALASLCAWTGAGAIHAPPARNHIAHRWWRSFFTQRKIRADYQGFWQEFTSQRTGRGDFRIALPLARRKFEDVQPKRRKDWKKRYAHIDALNAACLAALDGDPGGAP